MFQILKEEFLDVVMLSNLTRDEFDRVVNETICSKKVDKLLRDIYASGDCRSFAREAIVSASVINVLSERKFISNSMISDGYEELIIDMVETNEPQLMYTN